MGRRSRSGDQWSEWSDRYASARDSGGPIRVITGDHDPEFVAPPFLGFRNTPIPTTSQPQVPPPAPQAPTWTPEDGDNG